jgi:hypothetical protein
VSKSTSKTPAAIESSEITKIRQDCDRQVYDLRLELAGLRRARITLVEDLQVCTEGGQMLLGMVGRYQRTLRGLGWTPPDDELALCEKIRKDLGQ